MVFSQTPSPRERIALLPLCQRILMVGMAAGCTVLLAGRSAVPITPRDVGYREICRDVPLWVPLAEARARLDDAGAHHRRVDEEHWFIKRDQSLHRICALATNRDGLVFKVRYLER